MLSALCLHAYIVIVLEQLFVMTAKIHLLTAKYIQSVYAELRCCGAAMALRIGLTIICANDALGGIHRRRCPQQIGITLWTCDAIAQSFLCSDVL